MTARTNRNKGNRVVLTDETAVLTKKSRTNRRRHQASWLVIRRDALQENTGAANDRWMRGILYNHESALTAALLCAVEMDRFTWFDVAGP